MARSREHAFHAGILSMLRAFQLKSHEMDVYNLLSKRPMTISQLQKITKMSERSLRSYLDDLVKRNFVGRKLVEGRHLKYIYYASPGESLLDAFKKQVEELEKKRLRRRDEIIKGTSASMEK